MINEFDIKDGLPHPIEAALALLGLLVTSPLIALAALAIFITSRGAVLFRQERVGRSGRPFVMYKLRTMTVSAGGLLVTAQGDARVTPVGRLLRKTKIDELPELWNVIKGDMSLVGPRPEVARYVDLQNPLWCLVLRVRPGITDPMTMRLRNEEALLAEAIGDREHFYTHALQPYKLQGYLAYLCERSWLRDLTILCQTLIAVAMPSAPGPLKAEDIITSSHSVDVSS